MCILFVKYDYLRSLFLAGTGGGGQPEVWFCRVGQDSQFEESVADIVAWCFVVNRGLLRLGLATFPVLRI